MISVVILTKNEERNILDCLESISWADEIIVLDDNSEDRTLDVIKSLSNKKIKVYSKDLNMDFSTQRNYALSKTTKNWVLFLDADERVSEELREEINTLIINEKSKLKYNGFYIQRKDIIFGKMLKYGETGSIKILRLARKQAGIWYGKVHEEWKVESKVSELENPLIHYPHQTIDEFLNEINFYTSIRANELYQKGVKTSFKDVILYPNAKFILNYFIRLGFLDGIEGFVFALFMSFHSFLVRGKLWLLWKQK
ncbi:MAG: glycosyltransferase family 2 protein [Patescibacteria group bacterium]